MDTRVAHMITDALYELRKSEFNNLNKFNIDKNNAQLYDNKDIKTNNNDEDLVDEEATTITQQNLLNSIQDDEFSTNPNLEKIDSFTDDNNDLDLKSDKILKNGLDSMEKNTTLSNLDNKFLEVSFFC